MFLFVEPVPVEMCLEIEVAERPRAENGPTQSVETSSALVSSPGACCGVDSGGTEETSEADCDAAGGEWKGYGTAYAPEPLGACCLLPDGLCVDEVTLKWCRDRSGAWMGPDTGCITGPLCHCCCDGNDCTMLDRFECAAAGGDTIPCRDWPIGCYDGGSCGPGGIIP